MLSLPRFLAFALFVVLVALVAVLAAPAWRDAHLDTPTAPSSRMVVLSHRMALALSIGGAAVALTLVVSLASRRGRPSESVDPFAATRAEVGALARLAESSVAQTAELSRERGVRQRAEEDAQLKQQLLAQSFDEKIRLGRDLHDGIIQSLYAAGLLLESVRGLVQSNPEEAERRLDQTRVGLNNTIREVRAYITGLAPANLLRAGFGQALGALFTELSAGRTAEFEIKIDDEAAMLLSPEQSLDALQIAREAVSNALRHGGASRITVRVHQSDREICLLVQDNGAGFDATQRRDGGQGLGNMHARAERLGAALRVASQPGEGTRVVATFPIRQPAVA